MKITRHGIETQKGPSEWFTGAVHIDAVAAPEVEEIRPGDRAYFERELEPR